MDFARASGIAHQGRAIAGAYSPSAVDYVYGLLDLPPEPRILDVGCGKGEMLFRAVESLGVVGSASTSTWLGPRNGPHQGSGPGE
ncbi:MAG: hypothetical protein ACRDJT_09230 [Actinomycetota bacterium]